MYVLFVHEIYIALRADESRAQVDEYVYYHALYVTGNLMQFQVKIYIIVSPLRA